MAHVAVGPRNVACFIVGIVANAAFNGHLRPEPAVTRRRLRHVCLVTDPARSLSETMRVIELGTSVVADSVKCSDLQVQWTVQLRHKNASCMQLLDEACALRHVTRRVGAWLVVNGSLHVAKEAQADGVHYPGASEEVSLATRVAQARRELGEHAWVTTPAHNDHDVEEACRAGANAAYVSPIYDSPGPGKAQARGTEALRRARQWLESMPLHDASACEHLVLRRGRMLVYALGGITPPRAAECVAAGADGVAAIRGFYDANADDWKVLARGLLCE